MEVPNCSLGENGKFVFGDCAICIDPTAEELATIAVSTAETAKTLLGYEPKVAMLSFSTKGSAKHANVDKVRTAYEMVKKSNPELQVDGELQADAALIEKVGQLKSPVPPLQDMQTFSFSQTFRREISDISSFRGWQVQRR